MAPAQLGEDALHEASRLGGEQPLGGFGLGELGLGSSALAVVVGRRRGEGREGGAGDGVLGSARRGLPHERHGTRGGDAVVDAEGGDGDGGGVLGEETTVGHSRPLLLHGGQERLLAWALGEHPRPVFLVQHCRLTLLERMTMFDKIELLRVWKWRG